jgi:two-component system NtrC family response regulator
VDLLVVEDDPGSREALTAVLEDEGHTVRAAADATSAMSLVEERCPQLILIDYKLPDMTGLDLIQKLRARAIDTPFVLISGTAEMRIDPEGNVDISDHSNAAIRIGAMAHLTKPVRFDKLKLLLEQLSD